MAYAHRRDGGRAGGGRWRAAGGWTACVSRWTGGGEFGTCGVEAITAGLEVVVQGRERGTAWACTGPRSGPGSRGERGQMLTCVWRVNGRKGSTVDWNGPNHDWGLLIFRIGLEPGRLLCCCRGSYGVRQALAVRRTVTGPVHLHVQGAGCTAVCVACTGCCWGGAGLRAGVPTCKRDHTWLMLHQKTPVQHWVLHVRDRPWLFC